MCPAGLRKSEDPALQLAVQSAFALSCEVSCAASFTVARWADTSARDSPAFSAAFLPFSYAFPFAVAPRDLLS